MNEATVIELGDFRGKPHPQDLRFTRVLKAPRKRVFEAFTRPEHLIHWWAPRPYTMPVCQVDLRPGGAWKYRFRSPEGVEHDAEETFVEVKEPEKLVTEGSVPGPDGRPFFVMRKTILLEDRGDETALVLEAKILRANPGCEPFLRGAPLGFEGTLANLEDYLSKAA